MCYIRKNSSGVVRAESDVSGETVGSYTGVSNSAILHLVHGDTIDLGSCTNISTFYTGHGTTSFSGFLLQED